jgi:two-component system chemotaxis response regulator CheB
MKGALASSRSGGQRETGRAIRLMIVDDSMVARAVLSRMVETDGGFEIAAVAGTAEDAIEALGQVRVDIILLDLEMPGAGGLKSIPRIIAAARGAQVLIVSSLAEEGAEETVAALALGAADTLPKPGTGRFNGRFSEVLLGKLHALGHAEHRGPRSGASLAPIVSGARLAPLRAMADAPLELLMIGASTGGIHALGTLFEALPARLGVPILVTQHLPAPFMGVFARQLGVAAKRDAVVAEDGMTLVDDRIFIAPGDSHMTVELFRGRLIIRLSRQRVASGCLPSVDPMFASAGAALGKAALGVVLTGMGRDGTEGAAKLVACGGSVVVQDEASSAVWGMPRAVAEAGLASAILSPANIALCIASRAEEASCK